MGHSSPRRPLERRRSLDPFRSRSGARRTRDVGRGRRRGARLRDSVRRCRRRLSRPDEMEERGWRSTVTVAGRPSLQRHRKLPGRGFLTPVRAISSQPLRRASWAAKSGGSFFYRPRPAFIWSVGHGERHVCGVEMLLLWAGGVFVGHEKLAPPAVSSSLALNDRRLTISASAEAAPARPEREREQCTGDADDQKDQADS